MLRVWIVSLCPLTALKDKICGGRRITQKGRCGREAPGPFPGWAAFCQFGQSHHPYLVNCYLIVLLKRSITIFFIIERSAAALTSCLCNIDMMSLCHLVTTDANMSHVPAPIRYLFLSYLVAHKYPSIGPYWTKMNGVKELVVKDYSNWR